MAQETWKFMNIDKRCGYDCSADHHPILRKQRLLKLLKIPQWSPVSFSNTLTATAKLRCTTSTLLTKLPGELIYEIIDQVDIADILPLALTCSYLYLLMAPRVQAALRMDAAPWVGDRLIIIEEHVQNVPDYLSMSAQDLLDIETSGYREQKNPSDWEDQDYYKYRAGDRAHYQPHPSYPQAGVHRAALRIDLRRRILASSDGKDKLKRAKRLLDILRHETNSNKRNGQRHELYRKERLVLRNLTTKEYVRDQALDGTDGYYTLATPIYESALWTDDRSRLPGNARGDGRWAGHRFDVVPISAVRSSEWRDVSERFLEEMEEQDIAQDDPAIWEEECNDGARKFARSRYKEEGGYSVKRFLY